MTQNQSKVFSYGFEFAYLLASSGRLSSLCKLNSELCAENHSNPNLFWKKVDDDQLGLIIIAFGTTQNDVQSNSLLSSIDMEDNPFKFICSKSIPNFSLSESAFSLFKTYKDQLDQLRSEVDLKKPVIITGHGVGGAIASLFNLWLFDKIDPRSDKRPLCITFGSPLIGDQNFQKAVCQSSNWNYCFLHVAYLKDPLIYSSISNNLYHPFGIFLLCSEDGSSCFESSVSVLNLLNRIRHQNQGLSQQNCDYGCIVENLNSKAICRKDFDVPHILQSNERQESLTLQLWALGFPQFLQRNDLENLVKDLDYQEALLIKNKRNRSVPNKRLDEMKIKMAQLEWYKKKSNEEGIGYYDNFKNDASTKVQEILRFSKELNQYWEEMVEEVEKQPQKEKEGTLFRTRWLFAGTNYRRMVEPLDIGRHYREGKRDYIKKGRSEHYIKLEEFCEYEKKPHEASTTRQNVASILTLDSCFWAHVEEALISTTKLEASQAEKQEATNSLDEFEKYAYKLLQDYAVSPEIFLKGSSFMRWWDKYITIKGVSHDSELAKFMKNPVNYDNYKKGAYNFP